MEKYIKNNFWIPNTFNPPPRDSDGSGSIRISDNDTSQFSSQYNDSAIDLYNYLKQHLDKVKSESKNIFNKPQILINNIGNVGSITYFIIGLDNTFNTEYHLVPDWLYNCNVRKIYIISISPFNIDTDDDTNPSIIRKYNESDKRGKKNPLIKQDINYYKNSDNIEIFHFCCPMPTIKGIDHYIGINGLIDKTFEKDKNKGIDFVRDLYALIENIVQNTAVIFASEATMKADPKSLNFGYFPEIKDVYEKTNGMFQLLEYKINLKYKYYNETKKGVSAYEDFFKMFNEKYDIEKDPERMYFKYNSINYPYICSLGSRFSKPGAINLFFWGNDIDNWRDMFKINPFDDIVLPRDLYFIDDKTTGLKYRLDLAIDYKSKFDVIYEIKSRQRKRGVMFTWNESKNKQSERVYKYKETLPIYNGEKELLDSFNKIDYSNSILVSKPIFFTLDYYESNLQKVNELLKSKSENIKYQKKYMKYKKKYIQLKNNV